MKGLWQIALVALQLAAPRSRPSRDAGVAGRRRLLARPRRRRAGSLRAAQSGGCVHAASASRERWQAGGRVTRGAPLNAVVARQLAVSCSRASKEANAAGRAHANRVLVDVAPDRGARLEAVDVAAYLLSFDLSSINRLVRRTRPKSCIHSDTMFPTTCPHFDSKFIFR